MDIVSYHKILKHLIMLQFKTWNWAHTLCYHKRKAQWQQGKNNKKANNLLLLSLLKQNLKFLFGLLKLPSYTRNVITLQARIIRTQKWKRRLCKPLKEKHKRCSVFSKSLLCSSKTGIFFLLSKMLKTEIWLNQTSGSILYILNISDKRAHYLMHSSAISIYLSPSQTRFTNK